MALSMKQLCVYLSHCACESVCAYVYMCLSLYMRVCNDLGTNVYVSICICVCVCVCVSVCVLKAQETNLIF